MTVYDSLKQQEEQLNDLINSLAPLCQHDEALRRARSAFTEGMENLVYAVRGAIENEGVHFECTECGRSFPIHYGQQGCPDGHQTDAELVRHKQ